MCNKNEWSKEKWMKEIEDELKKHPWASKSIAKKIAAKQRQLMRKSQ